MRKVSDYPLVFVNDDDVAVIANGQVMCVYGSAEESAAEMVSTYLDNERAADVRGIRRRVLAIMGLFVALVPLTQGDLIAWVTTITSEFVTGALLAVLIVTAFMLFAFAINDYIRPEYVTDMIPKSEHVLIAGMTADEADLVDNQTRDKIMTMFNADDEKNITYRNTPSLSINISGIH